jgi:hypothetical protein
MLDRVVLVGLLVLSLPGGAGAQESELLAVGSRVRVGSSEAGAQPLVGRIVALEPDALVLLGEGDRPQTRVPVTRSTRLEVSGGRRSKAARGAMLGAAAGALPGLLMTFGDYNTDKGNPAAIALAGAAAGAALGSLIGLALRSEEWLPARMPAVSASVAPVRRGAAISFSLTWGRGPRNTTD